MLVNEENQNGNPNELGIDSASPGDTRVTCRDLENACFMCVLCATGAEYCFILNGYIA